MILSDLFASLSGLLFKEILSVICPFLFSFFLIPASCSPLYIFSRYSFAFRLSFFLFDILLLSDSGKVFFNSSWNLAARKVLNWCFSSCLLSYEDRLFLLSSIGLSISAIFLVALLIRLVTLYYPGGFLSYLASPF